MSHVSQGQAGVKAVSEKRYDDAIDLLTKATAAVKSPAWLLALAQAYQHKNSYTKALDCASTAYQAALERANRKNMIDAQYRRAVLLYKLHRYADADCCAVWSQMLIGGTRPSQLGEYPAAEDMNRETGQYSVTLEQVKKQQARGASKEAGWSAVQAAMGGSGDDKRPPEWNRAFQWRVQTLGALEKTPDDQLAGKVSVTPTSDGDSIPAAAETASELQSGNVKPATSSQTKLAGSSNQTVPLVAAEGVEAVAKTGEEPVDLETLKPKVDFYQTAKSVTVSLYTKNASKDATKVHYADKEALVGPLSMDGTLNNRPYWLRLTTPEAVNSANSRHSVSPRKVELVLEKSTVGTKWSTWGSLTVETENVIPGASQTTAPDTETQPAPPTSVQPDALAGPASSDTPSGPPAYPTSSKRGPQNWDGLADQVGEEEDGQDVNFFFKKLYAGASPEQQRAMMKSFTESNGTALSTDWGDVQGRKVETVPPDGVEAKKWDA